MVLDVVVGSCIEVSFFTFALEKTNVSFSFVAEKTIGFRLGSYRGNKKNVTITGEFYCV